MPQNPAAMLLGACTAVALQFLLTQDTSKEVSKELLPELDLSALIASLGTAAAVRAHAVPTPTTA